MQNEALLDWERRFAVFLKSHRDWMDGSHDPGHFQRVWMTAKYINREEGSPADPLILLAAAYFHDWVSLPKNHPQRRDSSRLSAERAVVLLDEHFPDFPREKTGGVSHAIHAHSFSAGVEPLTAEARILQDADRMEAIGAIGLARVFYTAGQLSQQLFDSADPLGEGRELNDQRYALDHFQVKLLKLPALMNTVMGRRLAEANAGYLLQFLQKITKEIAGEQEFL
jgi:uncharacterized protein